MPAGLLGIETLERAEIEAILDARRTFKPFRTSPPSAWIRCAASW